MQKNSNIRARNLLFFGKANIEKIANSEVLIAGIGGLGCVVSEILVRLGVKKLIIVDNGTIDEPDLGRQSLYTLNDLGKRKVEVARDALVKMSGLTEIEPIFATVSELNEGKVHSCCCVVDCLDNFKSRFELERKLRDNQPLIHGGIQNDFGQLTTVVKGKTPSLKEIYENIRETNTIPVSTPALFVIASLMAQETVNNILGSPQLIGTMLIVELNDFTFTKIKLKR